MNKVRIFTTLSLFVFGLLLPAVEVSGDRGVGVNIGAMEVAERLSPGAGYHLPEITVINTGDEPTIYELGIGYLVEQQQLRPDEGWFTFQPTRFSLEPGESRNVVVGIDVSTNAEHGEYFALVRAQTVNEGTSGTHVGVAAATRLTFTVEPASWLQAQQHRVNRWLDDMAPWTYILPAMALLAIIAWKARRVPYRIKVERR